MKQRIKRINRALGPPTGVGLTAEEESWLRARNWFAAPNVRILAPLVPEGGIHKPGPEYITEEERAIATSITAKIPELRFIEFTKSDMML